MRVRRIVAAVAFVLLAGTAFAQIVLIDDIAPKNSAFRVIVDLGRVGLSASDSSIDTMGGRNNRIDFWAIDFDDTFKGRLSQVVSDSGWGSGSGAAVYDSLYNLGDTIAVFGTRIHDSLDANWAAFIADETVSVYREAIHDSLDANWTTFTDGDNLGDHTATQDLDVDGNTITNIRLLQQQADDTAGIYVDANGTDSADFVMKSTYDAGSYLGRLRTMGFDAGANVGFRCDINPSTFDGVFEWLADSIFIVGNLQGGTHTPVLAFNQASTARNNYVGWKAPGSVQQSWVGVWPDSAPGGTYREMSSDASGNLSWRPSIEKFSATILLPNVVRQTDTSVILLPVETEWAPKGIVITSLWVKTNESSSYEAHFRKVASPAGANSLTVDSVATSTGTEAKDTSPANGWVGVDSILVLHLLDSDSVDALNVGGTYYRVAD